MLDRRTNKLLILLLFLVQIYHSISVNTDYDILELSEHAKQPSRQLTQQFRDGSSSEEDFNSQKTNPLRQGPTTEENSDLTQRPKTLSDQIVDKIRGFIKMIKDVSKKPIVNFVAGFFVALVGLILLHKIYRIARCLVRLVWRVLKEEIWPFVVDWTPIICDFLRTLGYALWNITKACWRLLRQKIYGISANSYSRTYNVEKRGFVPDMEKNETESEQVPVSQSNTVFVYDREGEEASIVE